MEKIYNYTFHYNHHTEKWAAIPRGEEKTYFNTSDDRIKRGIIYSNNINNLIEFLTTEKK